MRPTTFYSTTIQSRSFVPNSDIYRSTSLEPVEEETDDANDDATTVKDKGKHRLTKFFIRLRPRKSLHRSVNNLQANAVLDVREDDSTIARDDDSTVAVDNTTGSLSQFLNDDRRDKCEDEDSSHFLDDFSVTAFAPDDEQQPLVLQEESEDIWSACKVGDEAFVKGAILYSPETVHRLHDGRTPLYYASLCGHESIVRLLLEAGATDPERTAYLCALNQNIRSLIKTYYSKSISKARPSDDLEKLNPDPPSSPEQPSSAPRFTMDDSLKTSQNHALSQLSSLSVSDSSSGPSEPPSGRSRRSSSSISIPVKEPKIRVLRRKFSASKLVKAALVDPRQYAIPDLNDAPAPMSVPNKYRSVNADLSEDRSHDVAADDTLMDILLNTSLIDCREVVLPDILVDAVALQAAEDELEDTVSYKSTHKLTYEDKRELLLCSQEAMADSSDHDPVRAPLKATACGITAVLEEEEEEEGKSKCRKGDRRDVVADSAIWGTNGPDLRARPRPEDDASLADDGSAIHRTVVDGESDDVYVSLIKRENSMKEPPGAWERLQAAICHGCEVLADIIIK